MGYECFEVTEDGAVATVTMSRPEKMNSMVPAFWRELPEIINGLSDGGRIRAVVLASEGKHYCAGMDLAVFNGGNGLGGEKTEAARRNSRTRQMALTLQESFSCMEKGRMPVLAAIQGGCIGGAVDMVTAADMRYATDDAFFCIQEINIGMTADVGTLQRLPKLIPEGVARELAYTGRRMSAAEAKSVGLVNQVFANQADMLAGVTEIAHEIANKSPMAIWGTKQVMNYSRDHSVADGLEYIATWQTGMFQPEDMVEAFTSKSEGRPGNFPDLPPSPRGL